MKERTGEKPKIRVVDDGSAGGEVVRLGGQEKVLRLGEEGVRPIEGKPTPRRLEIEPSEGVEARDATVEEILDAAGGVESPEGPLEQSWGGEAKRWLGIPWGWFAVIGLICVGLSVWSLRHIFRNRHAADEVARRATKIVEEDRRKEEAARNFYQRLEDRVSSYVACASVEELLECVRDPERVAPLMRDFYAENPLVPEEFVSMDQLSPMTYKNRSFWMLRAETSAGYRFLLVEQTDDDDGRVDWETDVCHQPMPWERYIKERPTGSFDFRVSVRADNYYAHEFADQSVYRSLRLETRGSKERLFGYVLKGSEEERSVMAVLGRTLRSMPMMLRIEFPEDAVGKRSVLITEVISQSWCLLDESP
jgi:hypothetical protein